MAAEPESTMAIRVEDFLQNKQAQESIDSTIQEQIDVDLGNLLTVDTKEINVKVFRKDKEDYLLGLAKNNLQLLYDNLKQLPVEKLDGVSIIKLPEPRTRLPREKPVPKPKPPTKWEEYARLKGIQKKKKGRMMWDDETQQYRPRWGYKRKDPTKGWLLEVPGNADEMEDQFEKKKKEKQQRVHKNEMQRLRNIARAKKVSGVGLTPTAKPSTHELSTALAVAHRSTASLGQFMDTLPKEKIKGLGQKRKFDDNTVDEREKQTKLLKKLADAVPVLDVNRAANVAQHQEERQRAASKKTDDGQKKKKAGDKGRKGSKKGFSGKGGKSFSGKGGKSFSGKGGKSFSGKGGKSGGKGKKSKGKK